jgi:hypothetical protein
MPRVSAACKYNLIIYFPQTTKTSIPENSFLFPRYRRRNKSETIKQKQ